MSAFSGAKIRTHLLLDMNAFSARVEHINLVLEMLALEMNEVKTRARYTVHLINIVPKPCIVTIA